MADNVRRAWGDTRRAAGNGRRQTINGGWRMLYTGRPTTDGVQADARRRSVACKFKAMCSMIDQ